MKKNRIIQMLAGAVMVTALLLTVACSSDHNDEDIPEIPTNPTEERIKEYLTPGTDERPSWVMDNSLYKQYEQAMSIQVVPQNFLTSYVSEDDLMCATIGDQVRAVAAPEAYGDQFYFPLVIAGKGNEGSIDLAYYCSKLNRIYIAKDWHAFDSDYSPTQHGSPYEIIFYKDVSR